MKPFLLLAGLLSTVVLHAESTPSNTTDAPGAEPGIMETKSYELDRYSRLMKNSPFDFDVPPPPPVPTIPAMADWALAGLTKATDYSVVNLVNLKTQERLRLTRYVAPPSKRANETKSGSDIYTLESIQFDEGKALTVKNATAMVTKNGEQGSVSFDPKVLQMKPAAGKNPMQAMMPNGQAMPQPGQQPGAPNANSNQALMQMLQQRNAAQGQPQNAAQPAMNLPGQPVNVQPNLQPQPANVQPQAPAIPPQPQVFSNTGAAPGTPNVPAAGAQPRRRVVLPSNETPVPPTP